MRVGGWLVVLLLYSTGMQDVLIYVPLGRRVGFNAIRTKVEVDTRSS